MGDLRDKVNVNKVAQNVCPYCKDVTQMGVDLRGCASCGAMHHSTCVDELSNNNVCGACSYDVSSPGSIDYIVQTVSVKKDLEEFVEKKESSAPVLYTKALAYMLKDAVVKPVKFCAKGWVKTHFGVLEDDDSFYVLGSILSDMLITGAWIYYSTSSIGKGVVGGLVFGCIIGVIGGCLIQQGLNFEKRFGRGLNGLIADTFNSYLDKVKGKQDE